MDKRNVLYISNGSTLGGAENSLIDMLKGIREYVNPVVIIPQKGIIENKFKELGIAYYIVHFSNGYGKIGTDNKENVEKNFLDNYEAALQLQDIIKKENIGLIHINSSVSNVGAYAAMMANIPYIWHIREFLEEDFESEFWDKELKLQLLNNADAIITISSSVQNKYKDKYNIDSIQIYNGLDIGRYLDDDLDAHFADTKQNFIITGVITENKGQWDAVQAVKLLVEQGICNVHLTLVGRSADRIHWILKRYIEANSLEEYIDICPFKIELTEYRKSCQYALTTSKCEALGRCTIEAMLAGNIVIGANTAGTLEIIGNDETRGYLYSQGDSIDLANVMKQVIEESEVKKKEVMQNAQEYAKKVFALGAYAERINSLYEQVLENKESDAINNFIEGLNSRYNEIVVKGDKKHKFVKKNGEFYELMDKWDKLSKIGCKFSKYFSDRGIWKIAIYGMGNLGCKLYDEIDSSEVKIVYVIDKNSDNLSQWIDVKHPNDELVGIDALVIAVLRDEDELVGHYSNKLSIPVVGISQIIEWLEKNEKV